MIQNMSKLCHLSQFFSKFPFKTSMLRVLSDYFPYLVAREIEK